MTPMQSLKCQFDSLKALLPNTFKEIVLNKSEPKQNFTSFCGETIEYKKKGVKNDFVRIFQAKLNDIDTYSLAFSFTYIDLPQKDQTVQASLKVGTKDPLYFVGEELSVEKFRDKIMETLKKIQLLEDKNYKSIIELFKTDFELLPSHPPKVQVHSQRKNKPKH